MYSILYTLAFIRGYVQKTYLDWKRNSRGSNISETPTLLYLALKTQQCSLVGVLSVEGVVPTGTYCDADKAGKHHYRQTRTGSLIAMTSLITHVWKRIISLLRFVGFPHGTLWWMHIFSEVINNDILHVKRLFYGL